MSLRNVAVVTMLSLFAGIASADDVKVHDHSNDPPGRVKIPARPVPPPQQVITVSGFGPNSGPVGTRVTVNGTGFMKQTTVILGGRPVQPVSWNANQIIFDVPGRFGDGQIYLRHPGAGNDVLVGQFVVQANPLVASFAPPAGPVGTRVEIRGSGFLGGDQIIFNGRPLQTMELSPDRVVVVIPQGATSDRFTLVRPQTKFQVASRATFNVTLPAPQVMGFSPTSGPPGTQLRISGANFTPQDRVFYGRNIPVQVTSQGESHFDVVIPANVRTSEFLVVRGPRGEATTQGAFVLVLNPQIARFAPTWGGAGVKVDIFGQNFRAGDSVMFNGRPLPVLILEPNRVQVEIPGGSRSDVFSIVRGQQVVATAGMQFEVFSPPAISHFAPAGGPGGTRVSIHGSNFTPEAKVLYGGRTLPVVERQQGRLDVVIPGEAQSQVFTVETRGGQATSVQPFQVYTYSVVDSMAPTSGTVGTQVTIRGRNFGGQGQDQFFIGNVQLPVVSVRPNEYVVQIPPGAQSGMLEWVSYGRRQQSRFQFIVLQPPQVVSFSPGSGGPGTQVTIQGANFTQGTVVYFGNLACPIVRRAPNQIMIAIPNNAQGQDFFTIEEAGMRARSPVQFQVIPPLSITSFAPNAGPAGTQVTIVGRSFSPSVQVSYGQTPVRIVNHQPTAITVLVPAGPSDYFYVEEPSMGQRVRSPEMFRMIQGPTVTGFAPQSGPAGTQVTIQGSNFSGRATVWFGQLQCQLVSAGPNALVIAIPANAQGSNVFVIDDNGQRTQTGQAFQVLVPPPQPPGYPDGVAHEHAHEHPHEGGGHHHHPHAHPHRSGGNHHHPF
jgi:large repetitive protein